MFSIQLLVFKRGGLRDPEDYITALAVKTSSLRGLACTRRYHRTVFLQFEAHVASGRTSIHVNDSGRVTTRSCQIGLRIGSERYLHLLREAVHQRVEEALQTAEADSCGRNPKQRSGEVLVDAVYCAPDPANDQDYRIEDQLIDEATFCALID